MQINKKIIVMLSVLSVLGCSSKKNPLENKIVQNKDVIVSNINKEDIKKNNVVYFEFDKYKIKLEDIKILDKHIEYIKKNKKNINKITIEGHTDEQGTSEYNISLGEKRAKSVKTYLQSKGIDQNMIHIISYGKEKPIETGKNELSYSKNRRALIKYSE